MRRTLMIFVGLLALTALARSQDQVGCTQLLEDAREAYAAGMVELVPELLGSCLESGLSGERKQDAYILVIAAYIFDYLPDEADALMGKFLTEFPDYQAKSSDPSEFTMLLEQYREAHPVEVAVVTEPENDPDEESIEDIRARQREQQEQERQRKLLEEQKKQERKDQRKANNARKASQQTGVPGVGFILGSNLAIPQMLEPYAVTDPLEAATSFSKGTPGFHLGASFNMPLSRAVDLGIDLMYMQARYTFSANPYRWTSYELHEGQGRFMLPVSFRFHLKPENKNSFYLKLGVVPDYLLSAKASATRSFSNEVAGEPDVEVENTDVLDMRSRMNLYLAGGAGMQFPLEKGFIFAELNYQYAFLMCNIGDARYNNEDLLWQIYHVDSDFKLHYLNFSAGVVFNLFK